MSDNIPLEIQMEIMQRLHVNSLLQFRTVSKTWKSFIDGRNFIVSYSVRPTQPSRFLASYELVSQQFRPLGVEGDGGSFVLRSYNESLVLSTHSDGFV
ncbi:putative F-box protein [Tanacetum coccineum]